MNRQNFYRTRITLDVLSDRPVDNLPLDTIIEECNTGDFVLDASTPVVVESLSDRGMADALKAAASDPSFFMLDDDGNSEDIYLK